jgi:hypothetical protein
VVWKNSHADQNNFVMRTWTLVQLSSPNGSKALVKGTNRKSKRRNTCGVINIIPTMIAKSLRGMMQQE